MGEAEQPPYEGAAEAFIDHMRHPRNVGGMENPSGSASLTGSCGDSIGVQVMVKDGVLAMVRVQPSGCAYTLVCASAMSMLAQGRSLDGALAVTPEEVAAALGGLPEDHMHCARLAVNTLGEAIADSFARLAPSSARVRPARSLSRGRGPA